jgi:4-hydroxy-tetrahydrodipicolinate reductase
MQALILGTGSMGQRIRDELLDRGHGVRAMLGRPGVGTARPDPADLAPVDVAFEFSHASSVLENVRFALATGSRSVVVGTTGLTDPGNGPQALDALARDAGARIVLAPTFSIGAVLFGLLAEEAARLFGRFEAYDPYLLEWHRRRKPDRPSGTAEALARRVLPHLPSKRRARLADGAGAPDPETLEIVALRAGGSPGMHLLGFDADGESIELRITARDRSAYVAGALLAADRLLADQAAPPGLIRFETLIDDLLTEPIRPAADLPPATDPSTDPSKEDLHALVA